MTTAETDAPAPPPVRKKRPLWLTIAIAISIVLALIVLGLVALVAFFPKKAALAEVERQVEAATQRDLTLGEDISFTIWPALGFTATDVALSNPEGFPEGDFLAIDRVVFRIALMPLIGGDLRITRLYLDGPTLTLLARADGKGNWEFPTTEESEPIAALQLEDTRIRDGAMSFRGAVGEPLVLDRIEAAFAIASLEEAVNVRGRFNYLDKTFDVESVVGAPRAVLEQGETPLTAALSSDVLIANFDGAANAMTGALTGALSAQGASLRDLAAWQKAPLEPGPGFGAWSMQAQMHREGDVMRLTDGAFALDAIRANGDLDVITTAGVPVRVNGALQMASLDVNPYLPPPPTGQAGVEVSTAWPTTSIDLSGLSAVNADLNLSIGALKFQQLEFSNARLRLGIENGIADARLQQVALYGGSGTGRLVADGRQRANRIGVQLDVQNVQALPLLTAAIGFDKIEGRGRLRTGLMGVGVSQADIMRSLRGNASFSFNDGAWRGVNLANVARQIQTRLQGGTVSQSASTDFAELSATFNVANGVAVTQDLRMLNPFVRLEGQGLINIGAQTIDMRIAPRAVNTMEGQGGRADVGGVGVPFRVSGPWTAPQFRIDLGDTIRNAVRDQAQRALVGANLGDLGAAFGLGAPAQAPASGGASAPAGGAAPAPTQAPAAPQPSLEERARDQARDALGGLFKRD